MIIEDPVPVVGSDKLKEPAAATASSPFGSELLVSTPSIELKVMELFSPVVVDLIVTKPPNLLSSELFLLTPAISAVKAELDLSKSSPQYLAASKSVPAIEVVTDVTVLGGTLPPNPETQKYHQDYFLLPLIQLLVPSLSILNNCFPSLLDICKTPDEISLIVSPLVPWNSPDPGLVSKRSLA